MSAKQHQPSGERPKTLAPVKTMITALFFLLLAKIHFKYRGRPPAVAKPATRHLPLDIRAANSKLSQAERSSTAQPFAVAKANPSLARSNSSKIN